MQSQTATGLHAYNDLHVGSFDKGATDGCHATMLYALQGAPFLSCLSKFEVWTRIFGW